jgi:hypothetical protein
MGKIKSTSQKAQKPPARKASGPSAPTEQTVKRLFGLSSNRCAYPACQNPLIDPKFGSVLGEICHIKGEKPKAPRHDSKQTNAARHGFGNVVLMCRAHHKIIDDNWKDFPVKTLLKMKADHEASPRAVSELSDQQIGQFVAQVSGNVIQGSVVTSRGQQGGVTSGSIQNWGTINIHPQAVPADEEIIIEGRLHIGGGEKALKKFGTVGLCLDVMCKSKRPAKIRAAFLVLEGEGFAAKLHKGFGAEFKVGVPGMPEYLSVEFLRNSRRTNSEGYVLERDDVCHFVLPLWAGILMEFLNGPAEKVSIRVQFFDNSERIVLQGEMVQGTLRDFIKVEGKKGRKPKHQGKISLTVTTTSPEGSIQEGQVNQHGFSFTGPPPPDRPLNAWPLALFLHVVEQGGQFSLGCVVKNIIDKPFEKVIVEFAATPTEDKTKKDITYFRAAGSGPLLPSEERAYILPLEDIRKVREFVHSLELGQYGLVAHDEKYIYSAVPSVIVKKAIGYMESLAKAAAEKNK